MISVSELITPREALQGQYCHEETLSPEKDVIANKDLLQKNEKQETTRVAGRALNQLAD